MNDAPKPPRTLRELVDQAREQLAVDAAALMWRRPDDPTLATDMGRYRGVKEFLDSIDEMVKRNKQDDED